MKADLHIHSRHSDRPAEWLARRIDFPDSYSDPRELYDLLRKRGMDLITITDHNSIDGCLEIADRPGVVISEQITVRFPEDRCTVQLLVWKISEAQHREIQPLLENIYELQSYLDEQKIAHAVAHPLYRTNDQFSVAHFEKLILLFRCFEGINGLRDALLGDTTRWLLAKLTPEQIDQFANRHRLDPTHAEPWKKALIGGSDDHGGRFPAAAFTEVSKVKNADDFFHAIREGNCRAAGRGGTPLAFSHSLYNTIYNYASDRFFGKRKQGAADFVEKAFSRFMEGQNPTEFTISEKLGFVAQGIISGKIFDLLKPANASLWKQLSASFANDDLKALITRELADVKEPERRAFLIASQLTNQLAFRFFTQFIRQLSSGNPIESIRDISTLVPILLTLSPYLYAFKTQAPDRKWLREISKEIGDEIPPLLRNEKRAWFTDTLEDVNGVAHTIRKMAATGKADGKKLIIVTCRANSQINGIPLKNFEPIGEFELPEYELQKLSFPPVLQMLDYIQREQFTEIIISTPGPVGLTALLAAKMLGLRVSGIYHTDFPQYVRILTDDRFLETLTWKFMHWFYAQMDIVYVNSEPYRRSWIERGIAPEKLKLLPRGIDTQLYHPNQRDEKLRAEFGAANGERILLFVGRISKEKNLEFLAKVYKKLRAPDLRLVIVGDGPYLKELRKLLPDAHFTGYLSGADLAKAFASADLFLFPSTTDTFGNVILEALASGLPCVVSDQGGPCELIANGETGYITRGMDCKDFTDAARRILENHDLHQSMRENAHRAVANRDWSAAFTTFWNSSVA